MTSFICTKLEELFFQSSVGSTHWGSKQIVRELMCIAERETTHERQAEVEF